MYNTVFDTCKNISLKQFSYFLFIVDTSLRQEVCVLIIVCAFIVFLYVICAFLYVIVIICY